MTTTTMNGKLDLLDEMSQALAAPRTKTALSTRTLPRKVTARPRPARIVSPARRPAARPRWRISLEAARDSFGPQLLGLTLFLVASAGLIWLAFTMLQFFFAWSHLVTWIRATMI